MREHLYALRATSSGGTTMRIGPIDLGTGILLVDQRLVPNGWRPAFEPLTELASAENMLRATADRYPIHGADVFVALRRAIRTDPENDGADCPRAGALIAHLEGHRPVPLYRGDEECRLSECDHERDEHGMCEGLSLAALICGSCSAVYDPGGEWGLDWMVQCQIAWPCPVIRSTADHYRIDLHPHLGATL